MGSPRLHDLDAIPEGQKIGDILPVFAGIKGAFRVGTPNPDCACCRKPFTEGRKARTVIRLYPRATTIPMAFEYGVCGLCFALHQRGGRNRDAFLAAVERYHGGATDEVPQ